jgi:2'-5' RNA ligase
MRKKVVIGIDLDTSLKKTVFRAVKPWKELPVKWHKEDSLHIHILSLGWIGEDDLLRVEDIIANIAEQKTIFSVHFDGIVITAKNPSEKDITKAQIVRLEGVESSALKDLYTTLATSLHIPVDDKKIFRPLVEIGRMRAKKWNALKSFPVGNLPFSFDMDVVSLTIFEVFVDEGKRVIVPVDVFELA